MVIQISLQFLVHINVNLEIYFLFSLAQTLKINILTAFVTGTTLPLCLTFPNPPLLGQL